MKSPKLFFFARYFLHLVEDIKSQINNCFGSSTSGCLDCAYDSYKPTVGIGSLISISLCKKKDTTPVQKEIFISNKKCTTGSPCNGSSVSPYDNLIGAFVKEGNFSNSKVYSSLTFKILGSPHFVTRKLLPTGREQLFRRVNASIIIRPHYCEESALTGCFSNDQKPVIFLKVDLFYFFVANSLKVQNITFNGTDFHLHTSATANVATASYNLESVVCSLSTISVFFETASKTPCALGSRTFRMGEPKDFTRFVGLFNLEGIYDSPSFKIPELLIENCDFFMLYSAKTLDGWLALLVVNNNYPAITKVLNSIFLSFRFAMGLMYMHTRENFQYNKTSFYSSFFQNFEGKVELINITVEAYNDYNVYGNTFAYENLREFDIYGIFNIQNFLGEFKISNSIFKNIVHRARRHSLFILKNITNILLLDSEFRNITLLSHTFFTERINIFLDRISFTRITLYTFLIKNYFTNMKLNNILLKDFNISQQGTSEYETIKHNSGSLYLNNISFINTTKLVIFLFQIDFSVVNALFRNFETYIYQLFLVFDSNFEISNTSFININAICNNIFFFKTQTFRNLIKIKFSDIKVSNLLKAVNVYFINESIILNGVDINKTIDIIYPLESFIRSTDVGEGDSFEATNLTFIDLETDRALSIGYSGLIVINKITWENKNLMTKSVKLLEASFFKYIHLSSINLANLFISDNLIKLICSSCQWNLLDITVRATTISGSPNIIYSRGGNVSIENLIVSNLNFSLVPNKPASILFIQKGEVVNLNNFTVIFGANEIFMSIIYAYFFKNFTINNTSVRYEASYGDYFETARSSILVLSFISRVVVDSLIGKNLKEFTNDSIITQNGFLSFLASQSSLILYDNNNFSLSLMNISFINCSKFMNGVIGIINYNYVSLENLFIIDSSSHFGGAVYMNYIATAFIRNLYFNNIDAIYGGVFYLLNSLRVSMIEIITVNSSATMNGGVAFLNTVEAFSVQASFFINANGHENGGAFYLERTNAYLKSIFALNITTSAEGGLVYFVKGSLDISSTFTFFISASSGGQIYLQECLKASLSDTTAERIFIKSKGGGMVIFKVRELKVVNYMLRFVEGKQAQGNIYIENQDINYFSFENITIIHSTLLEGSFIFFYSGSDIDLILLNIEIAFCTGSILNLKTSFNSSVLIENFKATHNFGDQSQNLFIGNQISIIVRGAKNILMNNTANLAVFNLENSYLSMENVIISQLGSNYPLSYYFKLFKCSFTLVNTTLDRLSCSILSHELGGANLIGLNSEGCLTNSLNCFYFKDLEGLSIEKSQFRGALGAFYEVIYVVRSSMLLVDSAFSRFYNESATQSGADLSLQGLDSATIARCTFINNGLDVSVSALQIKKFNLLGVSFESPKNMTSSGRTRQALLIQESNSNITGCTFLNFYGKPGPSLSIWSLNNHIVMSLVLKDSLFEGNSAEYGGSIFVLGLINCRIEGNIFNSNKAFKTGSLKSGIAGVLYFSSPSDKGLSLALIKNNFTNNYAENFAPVVWSFVHILQEYVDSNVFINNTDSLNFSTGFSGLPLKAEHSLIEIHTERLNFYENTDCDAAQFIISGISFDLNITVKDAFDQVLIFDSRSFGRLHGAGINIQGGTNTSRKGLFSFTNIIVFFSPGQQFRLNFTFSFEKDIILPENYQFSVGELTHETTILSRPCLKGEIFNPDEPSCRLCPDGKYSLKNPMDTKESSFTKCQTCPHNAVCYSGAYITPLPGYWRASDQSNLIIECFHKEACKGFQEDLLTEERIHGRCAIHHKGPLCYFCESGYARNSAKGLCQSCTDNVIAYIRLAIGILGIFLYIFLQVRFVFKSKTTSYTGILVKLLVNHFQQISLISLVDLGWTPDIKFYFSFQEYISFLTDEFISIDCLIQKFDFNLLTQKVIISNILPVLISLLALVVWILSYTIRVSKGNNINNNYILNRVRVSTLVIVYILHPEILRKCFSLFNCMNLEPHRKVLTLSPDIECWSDDHIHFIYISALPGIIFWGFAVPLFIWNLFRINKLAIVKYIKEAKVGDMPADRRKNVDEQTDFALARKLHRVRHYPEGKISSLQSETKDSLVQSQSSFKRRENVIEMNETHFKHRINLHQKEEAPSSVFARNSPNQKVSPKKIFYVVVDDDSSARTNNLNINSRRRKNVVEVKDEQSISSLKFLYKGYSHKFFYWELVMFLKKIFLISIGSLTELFPGTTKPTVLLIILCFFLYLQTEYHPFEKKLLNKIELVSLIVTFLTSNIGILLFTDEMAKLSNLFLAVIIFLNALFLILWLWYFTNQILAESNFKSLLFGFFIKRSKIHPEHSESKVEMDFSLKD